MLKKLLFLIVIIQLIALLPDAHAIQGRKCKIDHCTYVFQKFTGGTNAALDSYDGQFLKDGFAALIFFSADDSTYPGQRYDCVINKDSAAAHAPPDVISPLANAGDKRWECKRIDNINGATDDDVPESGDFGAAADLDADGSVSADAIDASHMADADHGDVSWLSGVATVDSVTINPSTSLTEIELVNSGSFEMFPNNLSVDGDDIIVAGGQQNQIDDAETNWTCAGTGAVCSSSTSIYVEQSKSQVINEDASSGVELIASITSDAADLSAYEAVVFALRSDSVFNANDLQIMLCDAADCGTPLATGNIGAITNASSFATFTVPITGVSGVTHIGLYQAVNRGAYILWIDDMYVADTDYNSIRIWDFSDKTDVVGYGANSKLNTAILQGAHVNLTHNGYTYLFGGAGSGLLHVIDKNDQTNISIANTYRDFTWYMETHDALIDGDVLYFCNGISATNKDYVGAIQLNNDGTVTQLSHVVNSGTQVRGDSCSITKVGKYIIQTNEGLATSDINYMNVWDVGNPKAITFVSQHTANADFGLTEDTGSTQGATSQWCMQFGDHTAFDGRYMYAPIYKTNYGISIWDLEDPTDPKFVSCYYDANDSNIGAYDTVLKWGNYAIAGSENKNSTVFFDVTDQGAITLAENHAICSGSRELAIREGYLIGAGANDSNCRLGIWKLPRMEANVSYIETLQVGEIEGDKISADIIEAKDGGSIGGLQSFGKDASVVGSFGANDLSLWGEQFLYEQAATILSHLGSTPKLLYTFDVCPLTNNITDFSSASGNNSTLDIIGNLGDSDRCKNVALSRYIEFDGTGDRVQSNDLADFSCDTTNGCGVGMWVNPDVVNTGDTLIGKTGNNSENADLDTEWDFRINSSGALVFEFYDDSANATLTCTDLVTTLSAGTWYHVVGTWDGGNTTGVGGSLEVYVNGVSGACNSTNSGGFVDPEDGASRIALGSAFDVNNDATALYDGKMAFPWFDQGTTMSGATAWKLYLDTKGFLNQ